MTTKKTLRMTRDRPVDPTPPTRNMAEVLLSDTAPPILLADGTEAAPTDAATRDFQQILEERLMQELQALERHDPNAPKAEAEVAPGEESDEVLTDWASDADDEEA